MVCDMASVMLGSKYFTMGFYKAGFSLSVAAKRDSLCLACVVFSFSPWCLVKTRHS